MGMNYAKFKEYIKKNGVTKARITEGFYSIPFGTILFFGRNNIGTLSTYETSSQNDQFGYGFDTLWDTSWKEKYDGEFELIDEESPSENVNKMTKKTIYHVIAVDKKTGKTTKNETISADNEQQAIIKAFGVDAENTFIKKSEVGDYEEQKPQKVVIEEKAKGSK